MADRTIRSSSRGETGDSAESGFSVPRPGKWKEVHWEALHTFNPVAVVRNGKVYVLYRAEDDTGEMQIGSHTSRLGLAESEDGMHFTRRPEPVLYPDNDSQKEREWPGGVEDPRVVESEDGTYVVTYTQWNRKKTDAAIATSRDLIHWTKHGPALGTEGKYAALSYKSAGIVTRVQGGRLIAARIGGKYWMYWGEVTIRLASYGRSIHWKAVEDDAGSRWRCCARGANSTARSRRAGPPPVLTRQGIVVLYNGKNAAKGGDPALGANAYSMGEALFAADHPAKLMARPIGRCSSRNCRLKRRGSTQRERLSRRAWSGSMGSGSCITGAPNSMVGVAMAPGQ